MLKGIAAYGRGKYGHLEYGKGPDGASGGTSWMGAFEADGRCTVSFIGNLGIISGFTAAPLSTVIFIGTVGISGFLECDGHCTVLFISGLGAVTITCVTNGTTPGAPAPAVAFFPLADIPFSY